jgi:hypothetical protein
MSDSKLTFIQAQLEEARDALHEALRSADRLGLVGSCMEIHRAMSHVNSVLVEMDRKSEPELLDKATAALAHSTAHRG